MFSNINIYLDCVNVFGEIIFVLDVLADFSADSSQFNKQAIGPVDATTFSSVITEQCKYQTVTKYHLLVHCHTQCETVF